jgi:hypothetical protein
MRLYRFSPIASEEDMVRALEHIHFACSELCKRAFAKYLPVSGNIGIFCHFEDEYKFLTSVREKLTDEKNNWNRKYFRLYEPIMFSEKMGVPETTYTHLYIRKPDETHPQVGDADFVLKGEEFAKVKEVSQSGAVLNGVATLYRPDLNMIRLSSPDCDVLPYITDTYMTEKGMRG